jgi:hypothetical protein
MLAFGASISGSTISVSLIPTPSQTVLPDFFSYLQIDAYVGAVVDMPRTHRPNIASLWDSASPGRFIPPSTPPFWSSHYSDRECAAIARPPSDPQLDRKAGPCSQQTSDGSAETKSRGGNRSAGCARSAIEALFHSWMAKADRTGPGAAEALVELGDIGGWIT